MLGMTAPIVTEGRRAEDRALLTDRYANQNAAATIV